MIGLDTNVLARSSLVEDDADQAAQARALIASLTPANPGFVAHIVLVELWWLLTRAYKLPAFDVADYISYLCESDAIIVDGSPMVLAALGRVREKGADFADALIVEVSRANRCPRVATFDHGAISRAGMSALEDGR